MNSIRKPGVWSSDFKRLCLGNMLFYTSLYMILPVLPFYMVSRFHLSLALSGAVTGVFIPAMFLGGPLFSFLTDRYDRKTVYLVALMVVSGCMAGYTFTDSLGWVIILRFVQGFFFGLAATVGITLSIDITHTACRNAGNSCFNRSGRMGMVLGPVIGLFMFKYQALDMVVYTSVGFGALSVLVSTQVHTIFRAPIGIRVCGLDRFLLPVALLPSCNLVFIAYVFGLQLSLLNGSAGGGPFNPFHILAFASIGLGFILVYPLRKLLFKQDNLYRQVILGIGSTFFALLMILAGGHWVLPGDLLLGIGTGLSAFSFLRLCIRLSDHCQRATANMTYLLGWEVGVGAGLVTGCFLLDRYSVTVLLQSGIFSLLVALILFTGVTYRYYRKNRLRD